MTIRTVIVDDEPLARAGLRAALAGDPELALVGECVDGVDAVARLPALAPDLVLLDVQMPGLDGFEVLRRLPSQPPAIVFVTAHDAYAIDAFDAEAVDYLLKPYDDERLARAVARAKARLRTPDDLARRVAALLERGGASATPTTPTASSVPDADRLVVRDGAHVHLVALDDIDWIQAQDYYAEIHSGGRTHLVREPLRDLERRLDPTRFLRIHRSVVVRLSRVVELRASDGGEATAVLTDGTALPISRSRRAEVYARLGVART